MSYRPNNPNGQTTAANSAPVVLASDVMVPQDDVITILGEIQAAVAALASARGSAADLRVTLLSGRVDTVITVISMSQMSGYSTAPSTWNWQNQAACQSFVNNIARW